MRRYSHVRYSMLLALILLVSIVSAHAQPFSPQDFDGYVARVLKEFEVPGLAVAIVKDGKVVLATGYGVRELRKPTPVDEQTLFAIASNTKAFTTAALSILVDEGKIRWDDPVTMHLPEFQMYDPYVTREITIRDLLVHRSGLGLGAGDFLWFPEATYTRQEIVHRLRFIEPASSFRSGYAYDNVLYLVAGQIIPAVTDTSWDDFIKNRIFIPLGMIDSNTSVRSFRAGDNVATPHIPVDGQIQPSGYMTVDNIAPAGAINSNVSDMAKWVIAQLDSGLIRSDQNGDLRLFSTQQTKEMWASQMIRPIGEQTPVLSSLRPNFSSYGLGWNLRDYKGMKIVSHNGGLLGMRSRVTLVPDLKLGIVVLTNQESGGAFHALTLYILDSYLSVPPTDWIHAYRTVAEEREANATEVEMKQNATRDMDSGPSLPLQKYAGKYLDAWYGEVTIGLEKDTLVLRFDHTPALVGNLEHWQYDTFVARWRDRNLKADAFVTFSLNPDGSIDQMKMVPVSPLTDFSFDFQDLLFKPVQETAKTQR
ncbi:serine hydrolase [Candidatus Latescibacterota bacterium]